MCVTISNLFTMKSYVLCCVRTCFCCSNVVITSNTQQVPCGIEDEGLGVTTISNELSRDVTVEDVNSRVLNVFQEVFTVSMA